MNPVSPAHDLKLRSQLAVLWLLQTVNYVAFNRIMEVEGVVLGTGPNATGTAVSYFLPSLLAWLALASRAAASRWAHVVIAVYFAVIKLLAIVFIAVEAPSFPPIFNEVWGLLAAGLIVLYAWKLPKTAD